MKVDKPAIRTLVASSFISTAPLGINISIHDKEITSKKKWRKILLKPTIKLIFTFERVKTVPKVQVDEWEDDFDIGDDLEIPPEMKTNTIQIKKEMEMVKEFSFKMSGNFD